MKRLHSMFSMCNWWISTKQHKPNGSLFTLLSPGKQPRFTSYHKNTRSCETIDYCVIYSLCWLYFCICPLKWRQSWISILLPRRRQPIRHKYKHILLNTPSRSRNRWNLSRLPLLHSFLDTGAHILFRQRSSCWRVVKQSNQLSAPLWPEGPGTGEPRRAPSTTER